MNGTISSNQCHFSVAGINVTINAKNIKTVSLDIVGDVIKYEINKSITDEIDFTPSRKEFPDGFPYHITDVRYNITGQKKLEKSQIIPILTKEQYNEIKTLNMDENGDVYGGFAKPRPHDEKIYAILGKLK
jgi:hypothetical protein